MTIPVSLHSRRGAVCEHRVTPGSSTPVVSPGVASDPPGRRDILSSSPGGRERPGSRLPLSPAGRLAGSGVVIGPPAPGIRRTTEGTNNVTPIHTLNRHDSSQQAARPVTSVPPVTTTVAPVSVLRMYAIRKEKEMAQSPSIRSDHVDLLMDLRMAFNTHALADGVLTLPELRIKASILEGLIQAQRVERFSTAGANLANRAELNDYILRFVRETERDLAPVEDELATVNAEIRRMEEDGENVVCLSEYRDAVYASTPA